MSIASESLTGDLVLRVDRAQQDARKIAKENGAKIRRSPVSGIYVRFTDGSKRLYHGWFSLRNDLIKRFAQSATDSTE